MVTGARSSIRRGCRPGDGSSTAHGAAFCEHDLVAVKPPRITGGFRYLRFHGATGKYRGRYGKRALRPFARDLLRWHGDAYVYFNNDTFGHAIRDALDLGDLLGG